ncbi:MAG: UTP--glucose-1-phosphate uridylyltransferase, partial [Pseudomonadota bacterium]|nr:UTP--glucose-1-phosphate uridylyltransferase [Pseudomonadota bacterium]
ASAPEISTGEHVYGARFQGRRYACGSKAGFLQATVAFALERDDLRDELAQYLEELIVARRAAE